MPNRSTSVGQGRARGWGLMRHAGTILRQVWPVFTRADWVPAHQLDLSPRGRHQFRSTGADPHFRLAYEAAAGWYMLEVKLRLPTVLAETKIYVDLGEGESEANALPLRIRSERLAKRLVHLPRAAKLRFDPMTTAGEFEIQHLRLKKVGASFADKRLRQKLASRHPMHSPRKHLHLGRHAAELWADYCKLFEAGSELVPYADWIAHVEQPQLPTAQAQAAEIEGWTWKPRLSIVVPTYNTHDAMLRACLDSVLAQSYPHWELCIADDASTNPNVCATLNEYAARDQRIKLNLRTSNGHIVAASNSALELATGEFVVLLDHDDELAAHALFTVARALQERPTAQLIYSDEDKLDASGTRCSPYFKPDFSPDLLYSQNYFSHLGVYRRELMEAVGRFRPGFEGSQDYDLVLRCVARVADTGDIVHIPEVLYHWRMAEGSTARGHEQKSYANEAACKALQQHFDDLSQPVRVSTITPGIYRHQWLLPVDAPLVSLIVPTRDGYNVLKNCIDSILESTTYTNYEILLVDNQSTCEQTLAYMANLESVGKVRVLRFDRPFNYSAINNFAAGHARGSVLGLINNDVEVISPEWLTEMVSHAMRPDIGCVGAKLYYPNETIQHAGVVLGLGGVAGHSHKYASRDSDGYFGRLRLVHNTSALTGAALVLRKEVFDAVGGLDQVGLSVAFNDVDLCLKVRATGYRNLWTPFAELYHHESISRGSDLTAEKRARFESECQVMHDRWGEMLGSDPYYNRNLTLQREDYSLAGAAEALA